MQTPTQYSNWRNIKASPNLSNIKLNKSTCTVVSDLNERLMLSELWCCCHISVSHKVVLRFDTWLFQSLSSTSMSLQSDTLLFSRGTCIAEQVHCATRGRRRAETNGATKHTDTDTQVRNRDHEPTCEGESRPSFLEMSFLKKTTTEKRR